MPLVGLLVDFRYLLHFLQTIAPATLSEEGEPPSPNNQYLLPNITLPCHQILTLLDCPSLS